MLSRGQLWMIVRRSVQEFSEDNCTQMAAAISYYVLFSLFPFLILAAGILGIILQNDELEASFISKTIEYIDNFPIDKERTKDRYSEEQERFETCLTDSGVDLEAIGAARKAGTLTDEQMAAVESCKSAFDGDSHRENGVRKDDLTSDARTKLLQFRAKLGEQIRSGELTQDEAEAVWESAFEEKVYGNK